jgi:hypothetical protein
VKIINKKKYFLSCRLQELEERLREPGGKACLDSLLDTVTALIADCSHDPVKHLKNIEAYTSRCEFYITFVYNQLLLS